MAAFPLDYTVSKIISLLENEVSLLGGIHHEFNEIKHELISMRSFVEDADKKTACTEVEKAWVENVRDITYDVEDIIDEITYHLNRPQPANKFARFIQETIRIPKNLWVRHCVGTKLHRINSMIKAISERHQRYGVNHMEGTVLHDERKRVKTQQAESSLFIIEDELVGIENDKDLLIQWLTDGEPHRTVVSLVGMGGSGKTTLVAQAYNSPAVKRHFDCYAWISVSQNYVIEDLLRSMVKEFYQTMRELIPGDLSTMNYRGLVEMLVNFLKPLRYVVVLDDVWNTNLWTEIKASLPDGKYGSRVLLTTRKEDIAYSSYGVRSHVHCIRPLGKNQSWALFCMKAFSSNSNNCCPPELEILAKSLVERCEGLPLAIVALGGLMASKNSEIEWRKIYKSLNWELTNNPMLEIVKSVLLLSFNDLPYQLKHCFLYCCVFPEDYLIRRNRLIRLWMAEGFIEEIRGLKPEEVAESYLWELGRRSMLQIVRSSRGWPKACKMHDLMRELALSISEQEKFCLVHKGKEEAGIIRVRRLSIQTCDWKLKSWAGMSQLRSFFVFVTKVIPLPSLYSMPSGFRILRVLELEFVPIKRLPDEIGNLFNLRYLNLKGTYIEELPLSIGTLCNLETLNLYLTKVKALPSGIVKLRNLRYLIACHYNLELVDDFNYACCTWVPSAVTELKNLQVLHFVEVNRNMMGYIKNLTQLTCMGIKKAREVDEMALCSSIESLNLLCHLSIMVPGEEDVLHMDALSSPPPHLRRLNLIGKLEKVPRWFYSLENLTALYLSWPRLNEDPLPYIQSLPNLRKLTLVNAYQGTRLCFATGFCALKNLILRNLPQLQEIIIEKGVMPNIQNLWHSKCMALKRLPLGIEYLTNLQQVCLTDVLEEFIECIRGEDSVDRPKVQHIPNISHYYRTSSGWSYESLSCDRKMISTRELLKRNCKDSSVL